ncbi:uncharacterized protein LOC120335613 isoform X2 [Styela clava]
MVATIPTHAAAAKQTIYSPDTSHSMSQFDADGRRQIFGLSKAIRKHAYQSTSPSSEFKFGRKYNHSHEALDSEKYDAAKNAPTIEERLKNLLNSDTEGTEGQSTSNPKKNTFQKPPTYELGSKGCQGSYSPRIAESKMRERLNRTTGDEDLKNQPTSITRRTRSSSSDRMPSHERSNPIATSRATSKSPAPFVRRTQTEALTARQRRCVSAVPASFYDENWNVVPDHTNKQQQDQPVSTTQLYVDPASSSTPMGRRTPTGAYNQAIWNQRPAPSPGRATTLPLQSPTSEIKDGAPEWMMFRNRPESRTPEPGTARKTLEYSKSSLPASGTDVLNTIGNSDQHEKPVFRFRKTATAPTLSLPPKTKGIDISNHEKGSLPRKVSPTKSYNTVERKAKPIQYTEPPSPAYTRPPAQNTVESIEHCGLKVSSLTSMSSENSVPTPAKRSSRTVTSPTIPSRDSSLKNHARNQDPLDDERESRKSDDRDSGAILDAEASVFDFDSSVISESDDEISLKAQKQRQSKIDSNLDQSHRETVWSRSSTPTLPPLSPDESDEESTPRNSEPHIAMKSSQQDKSPRKFHNEVSCLPSYENLMKKKLTENSKGKISEDSGKYSGASGESHDHQELSPTESALAETRDKTKAVIATKNPAVKVTTKITNCQVQGRYVTRQSSRASSCDERRVAITHGRRHRVGKRSSRHGKNKKVHQHKHSQEFTYYDDIEGTEAITKQKQRLGRFPAFYRSGDGGGAKEPNDVEETSSVRSFTSASVTSSILRKGKRHHRRHHGNGGILDKSYAKEVRAVNKRFSRLEAHVVTLARSVAQLSSEMRQQNSASRDIEELREQLEELRKERSQGKPSSRKSSSSSRSKSEVAAMSALNAKAQPRRMVKLAKFFGEKPPVLNLFLTQMGYEKYIDNFKSESIGMVELPYMDEERLKSIGIPLGPSLRILKEAKKTSFV